MNVQQPDLPHPLGACLSGERCSFCVWAPDARRVELEFLDGTPHRVRLERSGEYHHVVVEDVRPGARYGFHLDGGPLLADPASRFQPEGVHGPSAVVATGFEWTDTDWQAPPLTDYVIYELHVGTFTPEGTFDAAATRVAELRDLGITAVELMPVAQFPGSRNWGYDGAFLYAVQNSYGGPDALKRFVDLCHAHGMAVVLDVVYNHLGPEGNYLDRFGPYFTDRYRTPWGDALNFDGPRSDGVREFFIQNALQWTDEFHIDALRLDAVHAILDTSAQPFLAELSSRVHENAAQLQRRTLLIAESDLGDPRMIRRIDAGGLGMDAQWNDDFHHALHALLTGETGGYYADFGRVEHLARAFRDRFVFTGQYSPFRRRRHGAHPGEIAPHRFVVCAQNHDQIGNRMMGDRLARSLSFEQLKLAAAAVLLSPFTPLLFMGEEYGEVAPFPYFVSHSDPQLVEAVRRGRAEEFASFSWAGRPPDPQAEETFRAAILDWESRERNHQAVLLALHRELLAARRELAPARVPGRSRIDANAFPDSGLVRVRMTSADADARLLLHFGATPCRTHVPEATHAWRLRIDTAATMWQGPGRVEPAILRPGAPIELPPHSAVLLVSEAG